MSVWHVDQHALESILATPHFMLCFSRLHNKRSGVQRLSVVGAKHGLGHAFLSLVP